MLNQLRTERLEKLELKLELDKLRAQAGKIIPSDHQSTVDTIIRTINSGDPEALRQLEETINTLMGQLDDEGKKYLELLNQLRTERLEKLELKLELDKLRAQAGKIIPSDHQSTVDTIIRTINSGDPEALRQLEETINTLMGQLDDEGKKYLELLNQLRTERLEKLELKLELDKLRAQAGKIIPSDHQSTVDTIIRTINSGDPEALRQLEETINTLMGQLDDEGKKYLELLNQLRTERLEKLELKLELDKLRAQAGKIIPSDHQSTVDTIIRTINSGDPEALRQLEETINTLMGQLDDEGKKYLELLNQLRTERLEKLELKLELDKLRAQAGKIIPSDHQSTVDTIIRTINSGDPEALRQLEETINTLMGQLDDEGKKYLELLNQLRTERLEKLELKLELDKLRAQAGKIIPSDHQSTVDTIIRTINSGDPEALRQLEETINTLMGQLDDEGKKYLELLNQLRQARLDKLELNIQLTQLKTQNTEQADLINKLKDALDEDAQKVLEKAENIYIEITGKVGDPDALREYLNTLNSYKTTLLEAINNLPESEAKQHFITHITTLIDNATGLVNKLISDADVKDRLQTTVDVRGDGDIHTPTSTSSVNTKVTTPKTFKALTEGFDLSYHEDDNPDIEESYDKFQSRIDSLVDKDGSPLLIERIKKAEQELFGNTAYNSIAAAIETNKRDIDRKWDETKEALAQCDKYSPPATIEESPPDNLKSKHDKLKVLTEFKNTLDAGFNQIQTAYTSSIKDKGITDETASKQRLEALNKLIQSYIDSKKSLYENYHQRLTKTSKKIFDTIHADHAIKFYKDEKPSSETVANMKGVLKGAPPSSESSEKLAEAAKTYIGGLPKGASKNDGTSLHRFITEKLSSPAFSSDDAWAHFKPVILDSNATPQSTLDIADQDPHVRGHQCAKAIQGALIGLDAHMKEHAVEKSGNQDQLRKLRQQYESFIDKLDPDNWGNTKAGQKRANYISDDARQCINAYRADMKKRVKEQFSSVTGSQHAKNLQTQESGDYQKIADKLKKAGLETKTQRVKELFKAKPELAKRWMEKSLALRSLTPVEKDDSRYQAVTQRATQSLLNEFGIPEQIPVAAFLQGTIDDIQSGDSALLPHLSTYYTKEKTSKGLSKADKYAQGMEALIKQEAKYAKESAKASFFRGLSQDNNGSPVAHSHQAMLDKFNPATGIIKFHKGSKGSTSGEDSFKVNGGVFRESFSKDINATKFTSTGEVFINLTQQNGGFEDQGLSFRTNDSGRPVELLGVRGCNWQVAPDILLNNPNKKIPFNDNKAAFIPIVNKDKVTGNESEGILLIDSNKCYLYTLTDKGEWRCRPAGAKNPTESSQQKFEGYTRLAVALAKEKDNDKAVETALHQAYKAYRSLYPNKGSITDFQKSITNESSGEISKAGGGFNWMNSANRTQAIKKCKEIASRLPDLVEENIEASSLSEARNITTLIGLENVEGKDHPAVDALKNKLGGYDKNGRVKSESVFSISHSTPGNKNFPQVSLSKSFDLCDKAYLDQLQRQMPENAETLIQHMKGNRTEFKNNFLSQLEVYTEALVAIDGKQSLSGNINAIDRLSSQLSAQESNLSGASTELYNELKSIINESSMNLKDVDEARKLWIQGKGPEFEDQQTQDRYNHCMWQLGQVNWSANRIRVLSNQLKQHKKDLIALERTRQDTPEKFQQRASQLNVKLAAITSGIQGFVETIQHNGTRMNSKGRSLYGFEEERNIQLRKHQLGSVPDLMQKQSEAIKNGTGDNLFLMEGTGGGKSMCMEAMVDNALNTLTQTDDTTRLRRPVLIIAPDNNAKQLREAVGLNEQRRERNLQVMDIIGTYVNRPGSNQWWNNPGSLKAIRNQLLGIDQNTSDSAITNELKASRSACLLSFSEFQVLQQTLNKALASDKTSEQSKELINEIRDFFINGVIFGDECVSGVLPYTENDQSEILENVRKATNDKDLPENPPGEEELVTSFMGTMNNAFLFTGLSATKATPAIGALFSDKGTHNEAAEALRENTLTTRLRACDRIAGARILRVSDDKSAAKEVVSCLSPDQGVTVLDTTKAKSNSRRKDHFYKDTTKGWGEELQKARKEHWQGATDENGKPHEFNFKMGYINDSGESMLYDPNTPRYKSSETYGNKLESADNKSLRAAGAPRMDNTLTLDQGVGSDPIQGENTAFMVTGVFGATEHGRFDLVEQWLGRGTRASNEPYSRQNIFLTVSDSDIQKIEQAIEESDNAEDLSSKLQQYKESKNSVTEKESMLQQKLKALSQHPEWVNTISGLSKEPLNITPEASDTRETTLEKLKKAADSAAANCKNELQGDRKDFPAEAQQAIDALKDYLKAEEQFQLDSKLLLFTEMGRRDQSDYTRQHEEYAFKGQIKSFEEKLYSDEQNWARTDAVKIAKDHQENLDKEILPLFPSVLTEQTEQEIRQQLEALEKEIAETLIELSIYKIPETEADDIKRHPKYRPKSAHARGKNKKSATAHLSKLEKKQIRKIVDSNLPDLKTNLSMIGSQITQTEKSDLLRKIEKTRPELQKALKEHQENHENQSNISSKVTRIFEQELFDINRRKLKSEDSVPLHEKISGTEFKESLQAHNKSVVEQAAANLPTTDVTAKRNYTESKSAVQREINEYIESLKKNITNFIGNCHASASRGKSSTASYAVQNKAGIDNALIRIKKLATITDDSEIEKLDGTVQKELHNILKAINFNSIKRSVTGGGASNTASSDLYKLLSGENLCHTPGEWTLKTSSGNKSFTFNSRDAVGITINDGEKERSHLDLKATDIPIHFPKKLATAHDMFKKHKEIYDKTKERDEKLLELVTKKATDIGNEIEQNYDEKLQPKLQQMTHEKMALIEKQKKLKQEQAAS